MLDTIATPTASPTATVCESLALFGGSPERGELDSREVWDKDDATEALAEAIRVIVDGVTVEGTQLADEREALLWGFVNMLHSTGHPAGAHRRQASCPEMRDLERAQDGNRGQGVGAAAADGSGAQPRRPQGRLRDPARHTGAEAYRVHTGEVWRPRHGSHASHTGRSSPRPPSTPATSAAPARTARPARTCPRGPWSPLPAARRSRTPTRSGLHSTAPERSTATWFSCTAAGPAYEKIAASWAEARGVNQVICRPDWNAHGKAAPFRRNDELLNFLPEGRHRVPRFRHHRQPRRQGPPARHPGLPRSPHEGGTPSPRQGRSFASARDRPFFCAVPECRASRRSASRRRRSRSRHRPPRNAPPDAASRPARRLRAVTGRSPSLPPSRSVSDTANSPLCRAWFPA